MKRSDISMLELKEKLTEMKKEEQEVLFPSDLRKLDIDYFVLDYCTHSDFEGSTIVYLKEGMAVIPHTDDGYDCNLYPNFMKMMDEESIKAVRRSYEFKKKELEELEFILDKQKLRELFMKG